LIGIWEEWEFNDNNLEATNEDMISIVFILDVHFASKYSGFENNGSPVPDR